MPLTVPSSVYPSERRSVGIALEATPGTGVNSLYTLPVSDFNPEDKVTGLLDESLRSAMAADYGYVQGPYVADVAIPSSIVYGDTIGHLLWNILGDMTETGTLSGTASTINNSSGYPAGTSGAITITSAAGWAAGYVQLGTSTTAEIVQITGATSTTATIATTTPTRFAHANTAYAAQVVSPYVHVFTLLNGTGNAQPPTHTITDYNYINSSVHARWYPFTCLSEIVLTGNAEQLFKYTAKGMGYANSVPGTTPTVNVSTVTAMPSWDSTIGLGGTVSGSPYYGIGEWEITLDRVVEAYWTADGSQNPYYIGRGKFKTMAKFNFTPAISEIALTELLSNTQPQMQIIQTNAAANETVQFDMQVVAFGTAAISGSKALLGYNDSAEFIANVTNTGNSAGYSPLAITVTNTFPTYNVT
jgi:hypothetical protein